MVSATTTITNPLGLHMAAAQKLLRAVTPFDCSVTLLSDGYEADAKSIISLMAASLRQGAQVEVRCCGPDEADALDAALTVLEDGEERPSAGPG